MKRTHAKLAALGATAVIVALAAAAMAFNLFIGWKVNADAVADLTYTLGMDSETEPTGRTPNYLLLDSSYAIDASELWWAGKDEEKLAAWFANHPKEYVVQHVTLNDWSCYAALVPSDDLEGPHHGSTTPSGEPGYFIFYIDTTSEQSLISTVNMAFVTIAIVGAFMAGAAGYLAGKRIDTAQEAQKRFYENMSHDLKTPLAAIRGYAEGASGGVVDSAEATRAIVRETDRMTNTINEILGLSRLEAGAITPEKEPIEVADFMQDCLMPMEGSIRAKHIDVQLDLAEGEVMADPGLFDHALSNVLTNAVRHAAMCMRIRYDGTSLMVWNDGTVPADSQIAQLFDRFHAGDGGSTGIGLAIAKEIAELHGWKIAAARMDDGLAISFLFSTKS